MGIDCSSARAAFVAVGERGFVTMMAVGDDQFLLPHGIVNGMQQFVVGDDPETVGYAVLITKFGFRGTCLRFGKNLVHAALGIGIEHKKLVGVRLHVAEKFEAIGFGAGERLFVAEDDASGIILEVARADEAATRAALVRAGSCVFLGVGVEGG